MSLSRKQVLAQLQSMFPEYEKDTLDSLLRANGNPNLLLFYEKY